MPRYIPHAVCQALIAVAVFFLSAVAGSARGQQTAETSLIGRLAIVETASRRITILPDGEADLVDVIVGPDGQVFQNERELTLAELVIQVGRRVTVHYRVEADRRVAKRIIVEPEG